MAAMAAMVRGHYAPLSGASPEQRGAEAGLAAAEVETGLSPPRLAQEVVGEEPSRRFGTFAALAGLALPAMVSVSWWLFHSHRQQATFGNPMVYLQEAEPVSERYVPLGNGLCQNLDLELPTMAWSDAEVGPGGSPECEARCSQHRNCTGFSTMPGGRCGIITDANFFPSSGKSTAEPDAFCWWRHTFMRDSSDLLGEEARPIPKVIWSYWHHTSPATSGSTPAFHSLCHATWRHLNPGYDVRILDHDSVWKWLNMEDLPRAFNGLSVQHMSDSIRLALLVKYGGVWVDATTMMTKPLSHLLGDDPRIRTFLALNPYGISQEMAEREHRLNFTYRVENWFIAAPPKDPFIEQTKKCVSLVYENGANQHLAETGLFSPRQLEQMHRTMNLWRYLTTHACFFKVLDEDAGLARWWTSPSVRVIPPLTGIKPIIYAGWPILRHMFFYEHDEKNAAVFLGVETGLLKWTGSMRKQMIEGVPVENLLCHDNTTFAEILRGTGITRHCPFPQAGPRQLRGPPGVPSA